MVHQKIAVADVRSQNAMTMVDGLVVLLCSTIERYDTPNDATNMVDTDASDEGTPRVPDRTANAVWQRRDRVGYRTTAI